MLEDFDESAAEKVLKILSVTGEYADRKKKQVKASLWSNLKRASKKAPKTEDFIFEKKIAEQKLEKLKKSLVSGEGLVAGIRPERFKIEKCDASADMNVQGRVYRTAHGMRVAGAENTTCISIIAEKIWSGKWTQRQKSVQKIRFLFGFPRKTSICLIR